MIQLPKVKKWTSKEEGWASDPVILTQVERNDRVAIYSRCHEGCPIRGYEVFLIKVIKKGTKQQGGSVEPDDREVYPRAAAFGFTAWCVLNLERAQARFKQLTEENATADTVKVEGEESGAAVIEDEGITWPAGKFSCTELAESYKISYTDMYIAIKKAVAEKILKPAGNVRVNKKGKKRNLFRRYEEPDEIEVEEETEPEANP
jgi:hypothetical protein